MKFQQGYMSSSLHEPSQITLNLHKKKPKNNSKSTQDKYVDQDLKHNDNPFLEKPKTTSGPNTLQPQRINLLM